MRKILQRTLACWLLAVSLCGIMGCKSSVIPDLAEFDAETRRFRAMAQDKYDELDRKRANGSLGADEYNTQKAELDQQVAYKATQAVWTRHSLAESERKANQIPIPGTNFTPPQPSTSSGGQSFYRSYNERYQGYSGYGTFGSGYIPGSSNLGTPRSY